MAILQNTPDDAEWWKIENFAFIDSESIRKEWTESFASLFQEEKQSLLQKLPVHYKSRFRTAGFFQGRPVLILSPYDIPHGTLRRQWMEAFFKAVHWIDTQPHKFLQRMPYLIHEFQCDRASPHYSVALAPSGAMILTQQEGSDQDLDMLPKRLAREAQFSTVQSTFSKWSEEDQKLYLGLQNLFAATNEKTAPYELPWPEPRDCDSFRFVEKETMLIEPSEVVYPRGIREFGERLTLLGAGDRQEPVNVVRYHGDFTLVEYSNGQKQWLPLQNQRKIESSTTTSIICKEECTSSAVDTSTIPKAEESPDQRIDDDNGSGALLKYESPHDTDSESQNLFCDDSDDDSLTHPSVNQNAPLQEPKLQASETQQIPKESDEIAKPNDPIDEPSDTQKRPAQNPFCDDSDDDSQTHPSVNQNAPLQEPKLQASETQQILKESDEIAKPNDPIDEPSDTQKRPAPATTTLPRKAKAQRAGSVSLLQNIAPPMDGIRNDAVAKPWIPVPPKRPSELNVRGTRQSPRFQRPSSPSRNSSPSSPRNTRGRSFVGNNLQHMNLTQLEEVLNKRTQSVDVLSELCKRRWSRSCNGTSIPNTLKILEKSKNEKLRNGAEKVNLGWDVDHAVDDLIGCVGEIRSKEHSDRINQAVQKILAFKRDGWFNEVASNCGRAEKIDSAIKAAKEKLTRLGTKVSIPCEDRNGRVKSLEV